MEEEKNKKLPFSKKFIHVGIVVKDAGKVIEGLKPLGIDPFKPFDRTSMPPAIGAPLYRGKPLLGVGCNAFVAKIGGIELELIEPVENGTPWAEFLDNRGEGIEHIAFAEDDLENEVARFTKNGATILLDTKWQRGGSVYLDIGIGNIIIELEQR
jgi:methylmalonyl-CoA/ethylmalonyl-CoA epimerase